MIGIKRIVLVALGAASLAAIAGGASAETRWQHHHPQRVEVNHRLAFENHRINAGLRDGQLNWREARNLRFDDRSIRREERIDARFDHGHITRGERRTLNHQENAVSRHVHTDRRF
jgi:hypothetical protein